MEVTSLRFLKRASVLLMLGLFALPLLLENILEIALMPSGGLMVWAWIVLFWAATISLILVPLCSAIRHRRIAGFDVVCWVMPIFAWFVYPWSIRAYCDQVNHSRADTWRWTGRDGTYYFVDSRHPEAFAGLIETFPPYFLLPDW